MVVVMGPFQLEVLCDSAVLTCCCLNTDNTKVNNSVQEVLILEMSVLHISWCGWESVFVQKLCRTLGLL